MASGVGVTATGSGSADPPPMFTPILFCLPTEGASISLSPLASTSTATATSTSTATATSSTANAGANLDGSGGGGGSDEEHGLPAALLPIANRPLIAFALQQLVSAGIRHAIVCAPAAQHSLFAHTLRQLHLVTSPSTTTASSANVQVLVDPLPGTSRRSNPSANTYALRIDLVPLGPADRTDKTRISAAGTAAASALSAATTTATETAIRKRKTRPLGSAELLLWLASEGWLEADPLILPYDLLTPSLPLTALLRAHHIAAALLPSTNFTPGSGPRNSSASHPLLLGATTLLIERRTPANTRSRAAQADAPSKERLKAERASLLGNAAQSDRLVVYSKEHFGALHGFSSSTVAAPHTGGFISSLSSPAPTATATSTGIAEVPHSAHALLSSVPLSQAQSRSKSTSYILPPGVGNRTLTSPQSRLTSSAHVSTNLLDSGIYVLPRAIVLPLLERFASPTPGGKPNKIRTVSHLVSLLARASADAGYARKMGIDNLVRRLARFYAQTHAERAGLDLVGRGGGAGGGHGSVRVGSTGDVMGANSLRASISGLVAAGGGAGAGAAAVLADSVQFGSANASPGIFSPPVTSSQPALDELRSPTTAAATSSSTKTEAQKKGEGEDGGSDPLLVGLGASMSRLSVSIAAAHSSTSRSSLTGERSSTAVRPFSTHSKTSTGAAALASAPAEIRVQALVARLETDAEAFVWGRADDPAVVAAAAAAAAQGAGKGGKGAAGAGAGAGAQAQVEQERFLGRVDTPANYLEANRFLLRALAAPTPSPLFPIPTLSDAGSLGIAPPLDTDSSASASATQPQAQPQITPDALIASTSTTTLGDRCVIRRSVVGKGVTIARGAKILGCVLMDGVSVGENAKLESVILAPHTTVGARASLIDVDAGPEGVRIAESTEAKAKRFGGAGSSSGGGGHSGANAGTKKAGRAAQALGFDESAVVAGLLEEDDEEEDSEEDSEEESEEEE
ncbi:unnamed protein product [Tilletia controversa]|uniref:Translation initiation factor eIF2B subunit gamma n=3 Tax=Tilletia TaxID=13289 RepID=A0A8X7MTK9_9BASI|nr:hypothetical protein CF336_g3345 [Tilletia laevis]KAE8198474.1 hypothetical protein CF328_g3541 [Tilletia controversa]KAE8259962.1 hypothetical protein A4X03_0g3950 [Tilletia caries]KAE8203363.1 hypothetical protein CF335_g3049 [Tilletia laevis]KAE8248198.1 hypothetical protein A4X06_0g3886 [Tilletia controversa]